MENSNDFINEVQNQINYTFDNPDLLRQAFTRRSWSYENGGKNNEELEFVGNTVLDFVVIKALTEWYGVMTSDFKDYNPNLNDDFYFDGQDEGTLSIIKSKLVDKKMLSHRIDILGFNKYLFMGKGDIKQHKEKEDSVKEDLFEAIVGAVTIDSNWNMESIVNAVNAMLNIEYYLENGFDEDESDYVALTQEWCQKSNSCLPYYTYTKHDGYYEAELLLHTPRGIKIYHGSGISKMRARFNAAHIAYVDLDKHNELWTIMDELPEDINLDNAINVIQELAQKKYQNYPKYDFDGPIFDENGIEWWKCTCIVQLKNKKISNTGYSTNKKQAKKIAAYCCICEQFGFENKYVVNHYKR